MIALLFQLEEKTGQKSYEEKRMEKLLRKTAKEIYKLRKTKSIKGQLDVQSFKYVVKKSVFSISEHSVISGRKWPFSPV